MLNFHPSRTRSCRSRISSAVAEPYSDDSSPHGITWRFLGRSQPHSRFRPPQSHLVEELDTDSHSSVRVIFKNQTKAVMLQVKPILWRACISWQSDKRQPEEMYRWSFFHSYLTWKAYTAKNQYWKFETNIPRKGIARLQVPIPTLMFLWAISVYFSDRSASSAAGKIQVRPNVGIYRSFTKTDTWMWKLGLRPRNSLSGEYINSNFFAVQTKAVMLQVKPIL
jgi:hypothetical protein